MATVTHYIRSNYDRQEPKKDEENGLLCDEDTPTVDPEDDWRREASLMLYQRPQKAPPQFVSATIAYDEWGSVKLNSLKPVEHPSKSFGKSVSGWYKSLTSTQADTSLTSSSKTREGPAIGASLQPIVSSTPKKLETRNKNNWFIMNAIQCEPCPSTPAPSLADMLSRDPPPLPSQPKYSPPVFLEIGPSNKGFGMLQRSGWNEGEALGPDVIRRKSLEHIVPFQELISTTSKDGTGKGKLRPITTSDTFEVMEVKLDGFDDVSELRRVDVIDLTISDSEFDDTDESLSVPDSQERSVKREEDENSVPQNPQMNAHPPDAHMTKTDMTSSAYGRKALLTPIATVLKSDRLGIGLKAKTVGPYKASQKRVTHNAAALASHVKAAEESRLRRKQLGRGHRAFEKQHKREEESRQAMLAYLKGS